MKKAFGLVMLAIAVMGCGGTGGATIVSPYVGRYQGNWIEPDLQQPNPPPSGSFDITIDEKGKITGTFTELNPGRSGELSGDVNFLGELTFEVEFEPDSIGYSGQVTGNGSQLTGTFGMVGVGYVFFPSFSLNRQP